MIQLRGVTDQPILAGVRRTVLHNVDFLLPRGRYAVLSSNLDYRQPLFDVLSGARRPRRGSVTRQGRTSWALGRVGFVRGKVTGRQLLQFVAGLYDLDGSFCQTFLSELLSEPSVLDEPVEHWPLTARHEFTYAIGVLSTFDIYFVEGTIPYLPSRFTRLWQAIFEERTAGKTLILSSVRNNQIKDYCNQALVLDYGSLWIEDNLDQCLKKYPLRQVGSELSDDAEGGGASVGIGDGGVGF